MVISHSEPIVRTRGTTVTGDGQAQRPERQVEDQWTLSRNSVYILVGMSSVPCLCLSPLLHSEDSQIIQ